MSEFMDAAIVTAEKTLQVLEEEADILRRFGSEELHELLPRKQELLRELHGRMAPLKLMKSKGQINGDDPARKRLRSYIKDIRRLNEANRVFIEGTLSYWREFLDLFRSSSTYGPWPQHAARQATPVKGLAFSREA
ncbi:MAG: hypothetical protein AB7W37_01270 [Syntrophobacteraceae bacterium]